jgi:lipopolysaccharide export system permease protein
MKLLDRYVGAAVVRGCVLATLALLSAFTILALVEELDDVGKARYRIADAMAFVLLTTPRRLLDLQALTALLGSVAALGALAHGWELTAMQAAGVSRLRVAWAALQAALLLMGAGLGIGQFVAPPLDQIAHAGRARALTATVSVPSAHGFWSRDQRRFVGVRHVLEPGLLGEVQVFEFDDDARLRLFLRAERASVRDGRWEMTEVLEKTLSDAGVETRRHAVRVWDSFLTPQQVGLLVLPPQSLSFTELFGYARYLRASGQAATRYELAIWQNASQPLAAGAMVMLAIPFAFGLLRTASAGKRIVLGAVVGIAYHLATQIVARAGLLLDLHPAVTTLGPVMAAVGAALWLFRRVR